MVFVIRSKRSPIAMPKRHKMTVPTLAVSGMFVFGLVCVLVAQAGITAQHGTLRKPTETQEQHSIRPNTTYLVDKSLQNKTDNNEEGVREAVPSSATVARDSYWSSGTRRYVTVYHQTSPEVCASIMDTNFHIGKGGLCGKAIYFALTPEATSTKAITANSHGGCMIQAVVDVGRQDHYYWTGRPQRGEKYCGGWNQMTAAKLHATGADSIVLRQLDGDEIIVFEPGRIVSKKIMTFNCRWMCKGRCQKHWPSHCHH